MRALVVAAALVLAGCSGGFGGLGPRNATPAHDSTLTPAPVPAAPATPPPTATPLAASLDECNAARSGTPAATTVIPSTATRTAGSRTSTPTGSSPASTPTAGTATGPASTSPGSPAAGLAPVVAEAGAVNAEALAAAHAAALAGRSFTLVRTKTLRDADGSVRVRTLRRLEQSRRPGRYHFTYRATRTTRDETTTDLVFYFADGTCVFEARAFGIARGSRLVRGADGRPVPPGSVSHGRPALRRTLTGLAGVEMTLAGKTTVNGTTRYRIESTGTPGAAAIRARPGVPDVRNVSVVLFVEPSGFVREFRVTYEATMGGERVVVSRRARYTAVGATTVRRPDWVDRIVASSGDDTPGSGA